MKTTIICIMICLSSAFARGATLVQSMSNLLTWTPTTESLGYRFTLNTGVQVTSLGYYDVGGNGLLSSHQVGLWDAAGSLLTQATISRTSPITSGFLYASLSTPITLTGGSDYYLAGQVAGDLWVYDVSSFTINSAFTYVASYLAPDSPSSLTFPAKSAAVDSREYFNVNLQYKVVPEPSQSALMLLGLLLLSTAYCRKRRIDTQHNVA